MARQKPLVFDQGVQIFFIQKILAEKYGLQELVGDKGPGDELFTEWSKIVRKNPDAPRTVSLGEDHQDRTEESEADILVGEITLNGRRKQLAEEVRKGPAPDVPIEYRSICRDESLKHLVHLLDDDDLGDLMQIEYSTQIAEFIKQQDSSVVDTDDARLIDNAVAEELEKAAHDLAEKDYLSVTKLSLRGKKISDITALARCKNLTSLDLSRTGIVEISGLAKLTGLQELRLDHNQLTSVAEAIGKLTGLQTLWLGGNQLRTVAEAIGELTGLQRLYLGDNQLTTVPDAIGNLTGLQTLYLGGNQLTTVPEAICKLAALQRLNLGDNQLTTVPEAICKLAALQRLSLGDNQLTTVPEAIFKLTALQWLNLSGNQLTSVPESLGNLNSLKELWLSGNQFSEEEKVRIKGLVPEGCGVGF